MGKPHGKPWGTVAVRDRRIKGTRGEKEKGKGETGEKETRGGRRHEGGGETGRGELMDMSKHYQTFINTQKRKDRHYGNNNRQDKEHDGRREADGEVPGTP